MYEDKMNTEDINMVVFETNLKDVTPKDVKETKKFIDSHNKLIGELITNILNYADYNKISPYKVLKDVLQVEQDMSIKNYKKYKQCLTRQEHIDIVNLIMPLYVVNNFDKRETKVSGRVLTDILTNYLNNRHFIEREKLYKRTQAQTTASKSL